MGNQYNDYYLLHGTPELGQVEGIQDLQQEGLWWSF
jgi:hypothetical protein